MSERLDALPAPWIEKFHRRFLEGLLSREQEAALRSLGMTWDPAPAQTPYAVWAPALESLASSRHPALAPEPALHALGKELLLEAHRRQPIPSRWLVPGKLLGPRRLLDMAGKAMRPDRFFLQLSLVRELPRGLELELNEARLAPLLAGFLEALLILLGKAQPVVQVRGIAERQAVLSAHWK